MDIKIEDIENKFFEKDGDFGAYYACCDWLNSLGFSYGSMQAGSPTAVFFEPDAIISKHRNLGKDLATVHSWITSDGRRFRGHSITFRITEVGREILISRASASTSGDRTI